MSQDTGSSTFSKPVPKRRNISKACEECRRRRAKCDGRQPSCSRCLHRLVKCHYTSESDGRRPAPKSYVELLRNRIDMLERVLRSHNIDVETSIASLMIEDKSRSPNDLLPLSLNHPALRSLDETPDSFSSDFPELSEAFEGALSLEDSLNFDQDGEMRYFGYTSGRLEFQAAKDNIASDGFAREVSIEAGSSETFAEPGRSRLNFNQFLQSIVQEGEPAEDLKSHLINLYFTWEQPWCWVVNEKLFRESEKSNGRYYSPLLLNCILAIACRFSDRLDVRSDPDDPNTAGRLFLEKAEVLLHYDLKWPSITTIQSLSIMGTIYVAIGADAAGWLHQGMANRMALDMGLNLDTSSLKGPTILPIEELYLRRQIYWALYCVDKLSASYTGRVCTMLDSQATVKMPSSLPPSQYSQNDIDAFNKNNPFAEQNKLHTAIISACQILEKILLQLYAPKPLAVGAKRASFLTSCLLELKTWFYDLPAELRIERATGPARIPQVYTLHMVYHTSFILLMKPFLPHSRLTKIVEGQKSPKDALAEKASARCCESAREICNIAKKYRYVFGGFRLSPLSATHCTLSAALVLLQAKKMGLEKVSTCDYNIKICLEVLEQLSTSWNPAKRIWESLLRLYAQPEDTDPKGSAGSETEQQDSNMDQIWAPFDDLNWGSALYQMSDNFGNNFLEGDDDDQSWMLDESFLADFGSNLAPYTMPGEQESAYIT